MSVDSNNAEKIIAKEEVPDLRAEIIESEKARIDLLKYKLIATATLAAIALGFGEYHSGSTQIDALYVICVIPFVCIYVDLLCWHNNIRILVIGRFLDLNLDPYEKFISDIGIKYEIKENKDNKSKKKYAGYFFELEDLVLHYSSVMLAGIIAFVGLYYLCNTNIIKATVFFTVAIIGIALPLIINNRYKKKVKLLFTFAEEIKEQRFHTPTNYS